MLLRFAQHTNELIYRTKQIAHGTLRLPEGRLCLHVRAESFSTYYHAPPSEENDNIDRGKVTSPLQIQTVMRRNSHGFPAQRTIHS